MPARGGAALAGVAVTFGVGPAAHAGAPSAPTDTQVQVQAVQPIPVPDTRSCTVVVSHHQFQNSYGAPDRETFTPPAQCPGPWSKVVLSLKSTCSPSRPRTAADPRSASVTTDSSSALN